MKRVWQAVFSFFIMGVGIWAVVAARTWPLKAALFPIVIGVPIIVLAGIEGILTLWKNEGTREGHAVDLQFTDNIPPAVMRQRALRAFGWLLGFYVLIVLVGFPIAIPLYVFLYLKIEGREGWLLSLTLTTGAWGIFYGLFVKLVPLPFSEGWIFTFLP